MIHPFIACLLSSYYVPGTEGTMMTKTKSLKGMCNKQGNKHIMCFQVMLNAVKKNTVKHRKLLAIEKGYVR